MGLEGSRRETLTVAGLCVLWYAISSGSNVVGKVTLTQFPFPMTVAMLQLAATALLLAPALAVFNVRRDHSLPTRYYWRVLVPLAFAKFFTTVFSQVSIWKVPVSYAHTVKATTPLWTALLAFILFGERQSRGVQFSLVLIACGVGLASGTEAQFDSLGLGAALAAAALLSLQHLYSKRVMKDTHIHHLRLLQTLSRLALVLFVPVWLVLDLRDLLTVDTHWQQVAPLLLIDALLAYLQAVVAFSVLSRVSPLAYGVASAAKRGCVVLASLLALHNPAPPANLAAMALALLGVLAYNRAKLAQPSRPPSQPLLPL